MRFFSFSGGFPGIIPRLHPARPPWLAFQFQRSMSMRHQAFGANLDPDQERQQAEARSWHQSFQLASLPAGSTTFARSSGPGGQHVNKTETKATTTWPISQLLGILPKILHGGLRSSKYYVQRNDAISIQAQTHRNRTANTDENRQKLFDEIERLYRGTVPNETDPEKTRKHVAFLKAATEVRLKNKKYASAKKQSRKGGGSGGSDY
ncbi:hypothetical protein QBC39DRAFT_352220 [Podospora conica]|nr:hypothetical protein QBC39DRAFT_352220 [Schizothecium conicum]